MLVTVRHKWEHALFFHLSYYNLTTFVAHHITPPRENNEAGQIQHGPESYLCRYHSYAVVNLGWKGFVLKWFAW